MNNNIIVALFKNRILTFFFFLKFYFWKNCFFNFHSIRLTSTFFNSHFDCCFFHFFVVFTSNFYILLFRYITKFFINITNLFCIIPSTNFYFPVLSFLDFTIVINNKSILPLFIIYFFITLQDEEKKNHKDLYSFFVDRGKRFKICIWK